MFKDATGLAFGPCVQSPADRQHALPKWTKWAAQVHSCTQLQKIQTHIRTAINRPAIYGIIHFDCECGDDNGIASQNVPAFNAHAVAAFGRHLPIVTGAKKMSIAWAGEHARQRSCESDMQALLHYSTDST